ncbi:Uncharacterised protein [[Clostridium] sordellii]|uniref:hypothetical protein n=1 Tax=Paraclostridium sordellii TaxID=1505 RepID=UPI0005E8E88E|nr:hypothetical protein [Paeniclostridium sordellii]MDU4413073.1 hypothetical protein [Paeniclostridium sordellii]MRZ30142.1 hypothetical protein [Paeniclostridium sordellii]CEO11919.1 Uncharacterised protein [[Clostridium] sordellii] [Paeniclostridium sordellii]CEO34716.1 Uncharacterised protein [[Clostridium] sordellii] [Paeniclostridium sordellii]CEP83757.1 Uncharacterised protein [[Clostridium] sordellii] [Paeniclostridium sordellii]
MKNLKVISTLALIMSLITMVGGIGVVSYYVDNLYIRGISVFVLIMSSILVANMVKLVFKEVK